MENNTIKNNRVYGIRAIRVKNGNLNSGFDNRPKSLADGTFYNSDVSTKYLDRDFFKKTGNNVLIKKHLKLDKDGNIYSATQQEIIEDKVKGDVPDKIVNIINEFPDVQNYGAALTGNINFGITGAVQYGIGVNVLEESNVITGDIISPYGTGNNNMVNTAGYANEAGKKAATLMYTEQWLEDVSWDIYIDLQSLTVNELREKLIDYILNGKSRFITYLGKTNHPANIKNVEILEKKKISNDKININSLFLSDKAVKVKNKGFGNSNLNEFIYKEVLPVAYTDNKSLYVSKSFTFSNAKFNIGNNEEFLEVNGLNLFFF